MFTEILAIWIIFQLIIIGIISVNVENEIKNETYICNSKKEDDIPIHLGILFPLTSFIPDSHEKIEYCKKQRTKIKI